jgi:mannose-6-phosphate isomerase-like protein (cupin superfamily)
MEKLKILFRRIAMNCSRRDLCLGLPALMASAGLAAENAALPSKFYLFNDLPVRSSGDNRFRAVLDGVNHNGMRIEMHETALAPGAIPHAPHRHAHEEIFMIRQGTLEVTIAGRRATVGPGSVAYVASNEEHGVRNPGTAHAEYFVMALGLEK